MQPEIELKFRCDACGKQISVIHHVSAVGRVCTGCQRKFGLLGRFVDFAESLVCDPADEQSVFRFRCAIRALQRLGQKYEIIETGHGRQLGTVEEPHRRKLVLDNYLSQEQTIITLLREHERFAVRPPEKRGHT